jgi:transcriptional regulator with XRE-family HTH domain
MEHMNSNIVTVGKKIRQIREAVGLSRPKFADLASPTNLKNPELGYREVGGAFLVALAHHPDLHKFTLWLLADKKVAEIGQIGPDDIAKA